VHGLFVYGGLQGVVAVGQLRQFVSHFSAFSSRGLRSFSSLYIPRKGDPLTSVSAGT
jgi:hypothetical protein